MKNILKILGSIFGSVILLIYYVITRGIKKKPLNKIDKIAVGIAIVVTICFVGIISSDDTIEVETEKAETEGEETEGEETEGEETEAEETEAEETEAEEVKELTEKEKNLAKLDEIINDNVLDVPLTTKHEILDKIESGEITELTIESIKIILNQLEEERLAKEEEEKKKEEEQRIAREKAIAREDYFKFIDENFKWANNSANRMSMYFEWVEIDEANLYDEDITYDFKEEIKEFKSIYQEFINYDKDSKGNDDIDNAHAKYKEASQLAIEGADLYLQGWTNRDLKKWDSATVKIKKATELILEGNKILGR